MSYTHLLHRRRSKGCRADGNNADDRATIAPAVRRRASSACEALSTRPD
jgi:hypothetical protein